MNTLREQSPRKTVQSIVEEYVYEDSLEADREDVRMGKDIQEMMQTRGWTEWYYPMFEELVKRLSSIDGVTTIKDLQARKEARDTFVELDKALHALIDKANISAVKLEQFLEDEQKDATLPTEDTNPREHSVYEL